MRQVLESRGVVTWEVVQRSQADVIRILAEDVLAELAQAAQAKYGGPHADDIVAISIRLERDPFRWSDDRDKGGSSVSGSDGNRGIVAAAKGRADDVPNSVGP